MIRVVNKRTHRPNRLLDCPVHRGYPLGNPYDWRGYEAAPEFKVGSRAEAIASYIVWLRNKIAERDSAIVEALNEIYTRAKEGDVNLVCYCDPLDCHASFIKEIIEEKLKKRKELPSEPTSRE